MFYINKYLLYITFFLVKSGSMPLMCFHIFPKFDVTTKMPHSKILVRVLVHLCLSNHTIAFAPKQIVTTSIISTKHYSKIIRLDKQGIPIAF
jgi:hypothetical protein